jgi:hypothetical protein
MKKTVVLVSGLLAAFPATANIQPSPNDTIVVTGSIAEARKQARSYVRELGIANGEQQAARWLTPICPKVVGIQKKQAGWFEGRLRTVSQSVGAPLAKAPCKTNLLVVFTDDADAVIKYAQSHPPGRLGHPGSTAVRKLKTEQAPVRWWYNVGTQSNLGLPEVSDAPKGAAFREPGSNREVDPPGTPWTTVLHHYGASLLSTRSARGIYAATVVIDANRTQPAKLGSLADYAALVGLAEINLGAAPDNSVLSLFKAQDERFLTERDQSFLAGLYRITMDREALLQRQMLVNEIVRPRPGSASN